MSICNEILYQLFGISGPLNFCIEVRFFQIRLKSKILVDVIYTPSTFSKDLYNSMRLSICQVLQCLSCLSNPVLHNHQSPNSPCRPSMLRPLQIIRMSQEELQTSAAPQFGLQSVWTGRAHHASHAATISLPVLADREDHYKLSLF